MKTDMRKYRLTFTEPILGTCPAKAAFEKYVLPKAPVPDDDETMEELETLPEIGALKTGFHRDVDGVYLLDYQVKGFFKEAANILKETLPNAKTGKKGVKALRSKIDNTVFIFPRYIYLAAGPDGDLTRSIRAQTPHGPRVAIGVSEYVDAGRSIEIKIDILPGTEIGWDLIEELLDYGAYKGIGQFRNGSYGRFRWERIADAKPNAKIGDVARVAGERT